MAYIKKSRKDSKGRALRTGESERGKYYIFQYKDINGIRRTVYAKDLPELREKERIIKKDEYDGIDSYAGLHITLNMAFESYIQSRSELKLSTLQHYKFIYNRYVYHGFGSRKLARIKYSDVRSFYSSLITERKLCIGSVAVIQTILHPIFTIAVRDGILRTNPTDGVMAEIKKKNSFYTPKKHALTEQEQQAFMHYISESAIYSHWLPLFTILLGTGCRIGEVLGLRWKDVDMENRMISINHSLGYRFLIESGESVFFISTPKTPSGIRNIPMMEEVCKAFHTQKKLQMQTGQKSAEVDGYSDFVFTTRTGHLYTGPMINRVILYISKSYNELEREDARREQRNPDLLPHFSCHILRHTFCTRLCENETDLKAIQAIMGHSDIAVTKNIYDDVSEERKKRSILNLEKKIKIM